MDLTRRMFLLLSGAAATRASLKAQARAYTLEPDPAGKTLKDSAGRVVLSYLTSKPEGVPLAGNSVCCIHPFNTPGGESATDIAPPDHRDHRGIFFAWHDMTFRRPTASAPVAERGVGAPRSDRASRGAGAPDELKGDFWGWGQFAPTEGRLIKNKDVQLVSAGPDSAQLRVTNDWLIGADVVMTEDTTIRASLVDAGGGERGRVLDLTYRFTSDYDVTINQMAFTGFCFRCRKEGPYTFFDSDGEVTPERHPNSNATRPETDWPARKWYSHKVTLQNGHVVSSAVIDHPSNPPSLWHGARGVSFLNPCISAQGAVQIPAGKPLTLRYLAVTRDGDFSSSWLDGIADGWRAR